MSLLDDAKSLQSVTLDDGITCDSSIDVSLSSRLADLALEDQPKKRAKDRRKRKADKVEQDAPKSTSQEQEGGSVSSGGAPSLRVSSDWPGHERAGAKLANMLGEFIRYSSNDDDVETEAEMKRISSLYSKVDDKDELAVSHRYFETGFVRTVKKAARRLREEPDPSQAWQHMLAQLKISSSLFVEGTPVANITKLFRKPGSLKILDGSPSRVEAYTKLVAVIILATECLDSSAQPCSARWMAQVACAVNRTVCTNAVKRPAITLAPAFRALWIHLSALKNAPSKPSYPWMQVTGGFATKKQMSDVDCFLQLLQDDMMPSQELKALSNPLMEWIKASANLALKSRGQAEVNFFGSSAAELGTASSDLDLHVDFGSRDREDSVKLLKRMSQPWRGILKDKVKGDSCFGLWRSRIPLVKLCFDGVLNVDVSTFNSPSVHKAKLQLAYTQMDPRVRPLVLLMKRLAKVSHLNDASTGSFNSYSLTNLVFQFLQVGVHPPILPHLDATALIHGANVPPVLRPVGDISNTMNLGELFLRLMRFIAFDFDFETYGISVLEGSPQAKPSFPQFGDISRLQRTDVVIQDPIEPTENTCRGIMTYAIENLRTVCAEVLCRVACSAEIAGMFGDIHHAEWHRHRQTELVEVGRRIERLLQSTPKFSRPKFWLDRISREKESPEVNMQSSQLRKVELVHATSHRRTEGTGDGKAIEVQQQPAGSFSLRRGRGRGRAKQTRGMRGRGASSSSSA